MAKQTNKAAPAVNDQEELAAAGLIPESAVVIIIGTEKWKGQENVEHEVSGNVANAIISKGMATLKT